MVRAGIAGEVIVRLVVGTDGLVKDASIVKSSQREFEAAVLSATREWRFREIPELPPAPAKGIIVDCRLKFAFDED
jgi:TonB family protein